MHGLLSTVIAETFEKNVGRFQCKKPSTATHQALLVSFRLRIDYDIEEGYRQLDVLVYGPANYVAVYVRERWTVIGVNDMDDEGPLPGKDYVTGASEWKRMSYHDSCWRTDGLDRTLREYSERIMGFDGLSSFYEVVTVPAEVKQAVCGE